jgi:coenzyme F420-reducing hydrogenase beta subunit
MVSVLTTSSVDRGFIDGVMVSVLTTSSVDRGFIDGVMVSVITTSSVDRGFIDGVMVSVLTTSSVDRGFDPQSSSTKNYKVVNCCVFAKHSALRRKRKDWLARNQGKVS